MPDTSSETQVLDPPPALAESVDLARRGQAGDNAGLCELVGRYQDRVRRIVSIRVGAEFRGVLDALDLVQATAAAAQSEVAGLEPRSHGSIIRWLARLAENQVLDASDRLDAARRDERRQGPADRDTASSEATAPRPPAPAATPAEHVGRAALRAAYDACVAELDAAHRDAILLRDYALLDWSELCEQLERPSVPAVQELH
ncbi:MAG TPA: hypothetical protein VFY71_10990, partial [Planctomycetota bacterium]|nr:hypothetical protein [Planctomycetota bacterium]